MAAKIYRICRVCIESSAQSFGSTVALCSGRLRHLFRCASRVAFEPQVFIDYDLDIEGNKRMEIYCSFTHWPSPIQALDDRPTPFPDISGTCFTDMAMVLRRARNKLAAAEKQELKDSYMRILDGRGDLSLPEDGVEAAVFSPEAANDIVKAAERLSSERLTEAISSCEGSALFSRFESTEDFMAVLSAILDAFREAADKKLGIILAIA